jgi:iron complex transport system permease protein
MPTQDCLHVRSAPGEEYRRLMGRKRVFFFFMALGVVILSGFAITLGSANIGIIDVYRSIIAYFIPEHVHSTAFTDMIVWDLRLPRVLMSIVAGMGLAAAGSVMQGVLKNPLASPFTLGISSAASFGASLAIILGAGIAGGAWLVIGNAFIFAIMSSLAIYALAKYRGFSQETLILAGIAIMYLFSALTSLLQYTGRSEQIHEVVFWMLGSMGRSSWETVSVVALILAASFPYLILRSWDLNALGTGDDTAWSMGVDVENTRVAYTLLASLITAGIICFTGTIGFIDLVSPHIARMALGGDHRFLLPGSALVGALLLLGADTLSRTIMAPAILPVGIMTSFLGVPFFVYLFLQRKRRFW